MQCTAWARSGRAASAVLALLGVVGLIVSLSAGLADADDTPGTTLTVTPNTNLSATQTVSVSRVGFAPNQVVTIQQAIQTDPYEQVSENFATVTANASGAFGPVSFTVSKTFTTTGAQQVTCGASTPCSVLAASDASPFVGDHAPISFAATIDPCAQLVAQQAAVNAQINAVEAALPAALAPAQRAAVVAQMESTRAQAIATFVAALVRAGCTLF